MLEVQFSPYAEALLPSPIREILQVIKEKKEVISLAGGLPNPETFPSEEVLHKLISEIDLESALQYGTTRGDYYAREQISNYMEVQNSVEVSPDNILITSGSQQSLNILPKIVGGDKIIVENPTYLGALIPFKRSGAKLIGVEIKNDGVDLNSLESILKKEQNIKFFYTIPTYQNPSGITMSESKRKELVELAEKYNLLIVEDDPYGALSYDEVQLPLRHYSEAVVYLGTASKIFAPGIRIGWIIADEKILNKFELEKQGEDLCTNTLGQHLFAKFIETGDLYDHIQFIRGFYKPRRDLMNNLLEEYVDAEWVKPKGGMFFWLKTNKNTRELFNESINRGIAYVPGDAFFVKHRYEFLRLNFTYASPNDMEKGIKILGEVLK